MIKRRKEESSGAVDEVKNEEGRAEGHLALSKASLAPNDAFGRRK